MSFLDNLPVLGGIGLVLSSIGAIGNVIGTDNAIDIEKKAVELQTKQAQVEFQQKTLNNIQQTSQLIDKQVTTAEGAGVSAASGSISAIIKNTYNLGNQTQKNLQDQSRLAGAIGKAKESSLDAEKTGALFQGIGQIGSAAMMAAML